MTFIELSCSGPLATLQAGNWLWEARGMEGQPAEVREALQQAKRAVEPTAAATSLGDRLVDTLTAQSLDLPPQAAKVGHLLWQVLLVLEATLLSFLTAAAS